MKRLLLLTGGSVSLGLGVVGIVLPILPTTPLLLLAAYCFMRSSPRLHSWLLNHRILGLYIRSYLEHQAVRLPVKIWAIFLLWVGLLLSMYLVPRLWLRIMLGVIGTAVTIHILSLKTLR